jgi:hypothetical protein
MLRTIEDILGITPLNLNDGFEGAMTEVFEKGHSNWTYNSAVPAVLRTTSLPLPPNTEEKAHQRSSSQLAKSRHDAAFLEARTRGMDFSVEDRVDAVRFNRIVWAAMKGDSVPYPTKRDRARSPARSCASSQRRNPPGKAGAIEQGPRRLVLNNIERR